MLPLLPAFASVVLLTTALIYAARWGPALGLPLAVSDPGDRILLVNYLFAWIGFLASAAIAVREWESVIARDLFFFDSASTRLLATVTVGYCVGDVIAATTWSSSPMKVSSEYIVFHVIVAMAFVSYLYLGSCGICVVISLLGELAVMSIHHCRIAYDNGWTFKRPWGYAALWLVRTIAVTVAKGVAYSWLAFRAVREPRLLEGTGSAVQLGVIVSVCGYGWLLTVKSWQWLIKAVQWAQSTDDRRQR